MSGTLRREAVEVVRSFARFALLVALMVSGIYAQQAAATSKRVGTIDLFGYAGWDRDDPTAKALREKLEARLGMEVRMEAQASFRRQVQGDVVAVTGKPATDVAVICCNSLGELNVFVGMQGESAIPLEQRATPTGPDTLPPEALVLYDRQGEALAAAIAHGQAGEDDSQGYALQQDPAAHAVEEQMRAFAVAHADVLVRVLKRSGAVRQRRVAAALLGYAQRSPVQVRALEDAMGDDDDEVRNNATRALGVLATAGPLPGVNVEQIIGLLYSGVWTDRNKAAFLLDRLTAKHDVKLLKTLREQALPPLTEGAAWRDKDHAVSFAVLLGRVAGVPEEKSVALVRSGHVDELLRSVKALEAEAGKH